MADVPAVAPSQYMPASMGRDSSGSGGGAKTPKMPALGAAHGSRCGDGCGCGCGSASVCATPVSAAGDTLAAGTVAPSFSHIICSPCRAGRCRVVTVWFRSCGESSCGGMNEPLNVVGVGRRDLSRPSLSFL